MAFELFLNKVFYIDCSINVKLFVYKFNYKINIEVVVLNLIVLVDVSTSDFTLVWFW